MEEELGFIPTEETPEGNPSEITGDAPVNENENEFDINTFLEVPEDKKFKSLDEFKDKYKDMSSRYDQYKDLESVKKELTVKQKEYEDHLNNVEELYEQANPEKIFGSKEAYDRYLIKQELTKDGTRNAEVVDIVLSNDMDSFTPLELIINQRMLNAPDLTVEDVLSELIYGDFSKSEEDLVDEDNKPLMKSKDEIEKILKPYELTKLRRLAADAKKELLAIKNTKAPEESNYFKTFREKREAERLEKENSRNAIKESWKSTYDSFGDIKSVQITDKDEEGNDVVIFDFPIDSGVLSKINNIAEEYVLTHNLENTEENVQKVREELVESYASKNWKKLVRAALTESKQAAIQENMSKTEYRKPINTKVNTSTQVADIGKKNVERINAAGW